MCLRAYNISTTIYHTTNMKVYRKKLLQCSYLELFVLFIVFGIILICDIETSSNKNYIFIYSFVFSSSSFLQHRGLQQQSLTSSSSMKTKHNTFGYKSQQHNIVLHSNKATLTEETEWRIRFVLRNVVTEQNNRVNEIFTIQGKFMEDEGYEPPQGTFVQQQLSTTSSDNNRLRITSSRWKLSEDPDDRRDSLWIWGLFKEPLYPFMLLQIETATIPTTSRSTTTKIMSNINNTSTTNNTTTTLTTTNDNDNIIIEDCIKPLQLYAQMKHRRDPELGAMFDTIADLKIRQMETFNADPFGVSKVEIYEEVLVGTLSIQQIIV